MEHFPELHSAEKALRSELNRMVTIRVFSKDGFKAVESGKEVMRPYSNPRNTVDIFIQTDEDIDEFACTLRRVLNLPPKNRSTWQVEQRREGANYGGLYYLFEVLGFTFTLTKNSADALVSDRSDWPLYITVCSEAPGADQITHEMAKHIASVLTRAKYKVKVD